jgi:hypothetical protein
MPDNSDPHLDETLGQHQVELDRLKEAFSLLGVNPCSQCKKFFRRSDPGTLFDAGELVCYGCIHDWWARRSLELSAKDRENIESKLVFWLRDFHHAETFKDPGKLPDNSHQALNFVAKCLECHGTGKSGGQDTCRFCAGRGTVWIVVPRK